MNERDFRDLMARVKLIGGDYAAGYQRGLRRLYHGEVFGTDEDHAKWMSLGLNGDLREELGRGYRDGYEGMEPAETMEVDK